MRFVALQRGGIHVSSGASAEPVHQFIQKILRFEDPPMIFLVCSLEFRRWSGLIGDTRRTIQPILMRFFALERGANRLSSGASNDAVR